MFNDQHTICNFYVKQNFTLTAPSLLGSDTAVGGAPQAIYTHPDHSSFMVTFFWDWPGGTTQGQQSDCTVLKGTVIIACINLQPWIIADQTCDHVNSLIHLTMLTMCPRTQLWHCRCKLGEKSANTLGKKAYSYLRLYSKQRLEEALIYVGLVTS